MNIPFYNKLLKKRDQLRHHIKIGIDTEDTWSELDAVNTMIKMMLKNQCTSIFNSV